MAIYQIEKARGLAVGCHRYAEANWMPGIEYYALQRARDEMALLISLMLDIEDRGEEYEDEWRRLAEEAKTADVGDVVAFPEAERAWRIVEVKSE